MVSLPGPYKRAMQPYGHFRRCYVAELPNAAAVVHHEKDRAAVWLGYMARVGTPPRGFDVAAMEAAHSKGAPNKGKNNKERLMVRQIQK